jgi:hypothetical protein
MKTPPYIKYMGAATLVNLYITLWHLTSGILAPGNAQNAKCQVQMMLFNGIPSATLI